MEESKSRLDVILTGLQATPVELEAFNYVAGDYLINGSQSNHAVSALKAFYHIGQFMVKLSENHTPSEAKAIRESEFEGVLMTKNNLSGCKKIYQNAPSYAGVKMWFIEAGIKSMTASRIWTSYNAFLNPKDAKEKTTFEKAMQALKNYDSIVNSDDAVLTPEEQVQLNNLLGSAMNEVVALAEAS